MKKSTLVLLATAAIMTITTNTGGERRRAPTPEEYKARKYEISPGRYCYDFEEDGEVDAVSRRGTGPGGMGIELLEFYAKGKKAEAEERIDNLHALEMSEELRKELSNVITGLAKSEYMIDALKWKAMQKK